MKIGLFGGTFDPIHWGHLRSAEEVSETFGLDRVYFVPTSIPPHKRGQTTTPASDRLQMVRLAVARNPRFCRVNGGDRAPGSFLFDRHDPRTLPRRKQPGRFALFHHRIGRLSRDRHMEGFPEIFPLCNFIVTSRPGSKDKRSARGTGVAVKKLFCYDSEQKKLPARRAAREIYFIELTDIAISASEIRALVEQRKIDPLS